MDPGIVTIVIAIAGATGTVLSFIVGRRERAAGAQASEASAAALISEGYKKLIDSLNERVHMLEEENKITHDLVASLQEELISKEAEIETLQRENILLKARVEILEKELARRGAELTGRDTE